jgi:kumamolisin
MAGVMPPLTALAGGRPPGCAAATRGRPDASDAVDILISTRSRNLSRGLGWVNRQAWWAPAHRMVVTRPQCLEAYGAADTDLATVRSSLASWGVECAVEESSDRLVHATGTVAALQRAFGVTLELHDGGHRGRSGAIQLPPRLVGAVRAVSGLDGCTTLQPYVTGTSSRRSAASRERLETAWGLPGELLGEGACVAVTAPAELDVAQLAAAGLPEGVAVLGASQGRQAPPGWAEATVAQVHAVRLAAPAARVIVHAGRGGESGAVETLAAAIHDAVNAPQVVLAGWGAPEAEWSPQVMVALEQRFLTAAAMGVTIVCAAPLGSAVFPASAPHALACAPAGSGSRSRSADSAVFPAPAWQERAGAAPVAARRLPDTLAPGVVRRPGGGLVEGAGVAAAICAGVLATLAPAARAPLGYIQPLLVGEAGTSVPREPDIAALIARFETAVPAPTVPAPFGSRAHPPVIGGARRA